MNPGDQVKYTPHPEQKIFGLFDVSGILYSIDEGYRAYIIAEKNIHGTTIKKGDLVKILLKTGTLKKEENV